MTRYLQPNMNPLLHPGQRLLVTLLLFVPPALAQTVSGRVVSPTGQPIFGITVDAGSGSTAATTDAAGLFTITGLAIDDYDIEYLPPIGAPWTARSINTVVTGAMNVGDIVLQPGFAISGTVRNEAGAPLFSCNANAYDQNGVKLFTPHDGTDLAGNFSITVPAGTSEVRILPPVGAPLVPYVNGGLSVSAPLALGNVTLRNGHVVSGTVADTTTSVPVGQTRIKAFDAVTGQRIHLVTDTANTFGQWSILLPTGTLDLEFSPPVTNTHVGRRVYGALITGPTALGTIGLQNGVLVSGTVTGPSGAVAGADIDVLDAQGTKIFTANDIAGANGAFSIAVPTGTGWRMRVEPPANLGLVGHLTPALTLSGPTALGAIALAAGIPVTVLVRGPIGVEADTHLVFQDAATGAEVVTVGDRTDATGACTTFVPAGRYRVIFASAEGSHGRSVAARVTIGSASNWRVRLPSKEVRSALASIGIPTLAQGGQLFSDLRVQSLIGSNRATTMEFVIRSPSGAEYPVGPAVPFAALPVELPISGWVSLPILPAGEVGKLLRFEVRFLDPATLDVLDRASTEFYLQ